MGRPPVRSIGAAGPRAQNNGAVSTRRDFVERTIFGGRHPGDGPRHPCRGAALTPRLATLNIDQRGFNASSALRANIDKIRPLRAPSRLRRPERFNASLPYGQIRQAKALRAPSRLSGQKLRPGVPGPDAA